MKNTESKVAHIFRLLEMLFLGRELYAQDETLKEELGVDERTIRRYLEDIESLYSHIIITQKQNKTVGGRKVTVYRKVDIKQDIANILEFFINNDNKEFGWLLQLIYSNDPNILKNLSTNDKETIERQIKKDSDILLFRSNPFENISSPAIIKQFKALKIAVKNREYKTIDYEYTHKELLEDVKCIKLIFSKNNWYLAIETEEKKFRLLRVAFIKDIKYSKKTSFQKSVLEEYKEYFKNMQNPMSLPIPPKKALLRIRGRVAIYFKDGMKPFFESQRFIKEEDGYVYFSIDYTQPIEIMPFIKEWLPDMEIVEPKELREELMDELRGYIDKNDTN